MPRIDRYTPKTVINAFESCKKTLTKDSGMSNSINTSSTLTRIIQETGRFCERFASDMFITWQAVEKLYTNRKDITGSETYYETFAIRRDGVDGNSFLICRLRDTITGPFDYVHVTHEYRKVLCLKIQITPAEPGSCLYPDVTMELRDITDCFNKLDPEDKEE